MGGPQTGYSHGSGAVLPFAYTLNMWEITLEYGKFAGHVDQL